MAKCRRPVLRAGDLSVSRLLTQSHPCTVYGLWKKQPIAAELENPEAALPSERRRHGRSASAASEEPPLQPGRRPRSDEAPAQPEQGNKTTVRGMEKKDERSTRGNGESILCRRNEAHRTPDGTLATRAPNLSPASENLCGSSDSDKAIEGLMRCGCGSEKESTSLTWGLEAKICGRKERHESDRLILHSTPQEESTRCPGETLSPGGLGR
uniref:Uncharacterized protein n=1 Tax=Rangifer tarandus platyrhynchus TaxID=3082113 RepID=A0ACB0F901_RANTA|nr:unnamed protein product [Rangifer tarandus platyrhynchus]